MEGKVFKKGIFFALLAACLYALSTPFSKMFLSYIPSTLMAGLLYLGAGIGMGVFYILTIKQRKVKEIKLMKSDLPYVIYMVILDILAPILLLWGLKYSNAASVSLLNNFEIVATSLIALIVFKEKISLRLSLGILIITLSCILLSFENSSSLEFSYGSVLVLLACFCWGIENNCTRKLSAKDPFQIVIIKGIFSGIGSLVIGLVINERIEKIWIAFLVLLLGFIAYGLSIFFYIYAQRYLGATRTSAYYAVSPFIGSFLSLILLQEMPNYLYFISLFLMIIGVFLSSSDKPLTLKKKNE